MPTIFHKTILATAVIALATLASTTVVFAQAGSPADTIKARQQRLKDMGAALKSVTDQMRDKKDLVEIKKAAEIIKKGSQDISGWFPKGTGVEAGVKTAALEVIWSDVEGFAAATQKFQTQAANFADVVDKGDIAAVGAALKTLGPSCGGCHDKYRVKKD